MNGEQTPDAKKDRQNKSSELNYPEKAFNIEK
jgi:hypothetical protein